MADLFQEVAPIMRWPRVPKRCFTLVELLIVVVILGILSMVVIPQFADAGSDARCSALMENLAIIRKQLEMYKLQHLGNYPLLGKFEQQLTRKTNPNGSFVPTPQFGPYLNRIPNNPFTTGAVRNGVTQSSQGPDQAWWYDMSTGEFRANDGGSTNGVPHASL